MKAILAAAAVFASGTLLTPTVACAQQPESVTAQVDYSDLDLASAAGQRRLEARVGRAVRQLCAEDGERGLRARSREKACMADATASAERELGLALAGRNVRLAVRS